MNGGSETIAQIDQRLDTLEEDITELRNPQQNNTTSLTTLQGYLLEQRGNGQQS